MCETLIADGFASGLSEKLAGYVIKCLAVGGGFLVGYFVGGAVAWALDRWVFAHKAPVQLKKLCSFLCGLVLAIIVALIVFGDGGGGLLGGGGAPGDGKGTPAPEDKGKQQPTPPVPPQDDPKIVLPKVEPKPSDPKPTPGDVRVAILSGADVRDGKFYVLDSEATPKTFDELKKAITDRRANTKIELTLVFRFAKDPLSNSHPEMKRLSAWVQESKLRFRYE
ncbi:hypothetical protein J8F10_00135 [Gemmata sp. G18]|uniref:Uncharacterized protein n=1 Tax=Gemmata palustris TaxID=2822762 RepID=A0ABS5BJ27_9BACT|nr:hypothetical protein [Gemmata palustris]MBP3953709.1 hypothetical protein [Gemmata palustris]